MSYKLSYYCFPVLIWVFSPLLAWLKKQYPWLVHSRGGSRNRMEGLSPPSSPLSLPLPLLPPTPPLLSVVIQHLRWICPLVHYKYLFLLLLRYITSNIFHVEYFLPIFAATRRVPSSIEMFYFQRYLVIKFLRIFHDHFNGN